MSKANSFASLKDYWDLKSAMDTYLKESEEIGEQKKAVATATLMLADNEPIDKIVKYTGLSAAEIESLKTKK